MTKTMTMTMMLIKGNCQINIKTFIMNNTQGFPAQFVRLETFRLSTNCTPHSVISDEPLMHCFLGHV